MFVSATTLDEMAVIGEYYNAPSYTPLLWSLSESIKGHTPVLAGLGRTKSTMQQPLTGRPRVI